MCSLVRQTRSVFDCFRKEIMTTRNNKQEEQTKMAVVLKNLEQTMDPLIAAQVWNNKHSPLARLPEEILLRIFGSLDSHDVVSLCCLRRTCRTFRRIIYERHFWRVISPKRTRTGMYSFSENHLEFSMTQANKLKQLLQMDGMCDKCSIYCDGPVKGISKRILHYWCSEYGPTRVFQPHCKFQEGGGQHKQCPCCGQDHEMVSFQKVEVSKVEARKCLGREGSVKLCEHVHISWSQIEKHLKKWCSSSTTRKEWENCFKAFNVECHHASHDTRCTLDGAPTWPRARLGRSQLDPSRVVLILEWEPHSGFDSFNIADGKAPASELRERFKTYRQGAARLFLPAYPSNPLPEMVCFDPGRCNCVHYATGQQDEQSTTEDPEQYSFGRNLWYHCNASSHSLERNYGLGHNGQRVDHTKHFPMGFGKPTCLVTRYQRDITVCLTTDSRSGIIPPTHEWFHAMDPDTYPHPNNPHALPLCKDEKCMNYYKKPYTYCDFKRL
ncbi:uncharacterized protein F4807DRAFT_424740 [Annulohypoxylon truncatum]|uniref:uncharacterized protein n=1 Tax=Annulohypoxylon truncatum TaxID=327061 RepID=UPI002007F993|nr:uncharacterized protein F4807DRAFT_424740 [Annulohypoxylon truncatum]KAI1209881.1 hypothetical protein F4807DRAFT_424740 [Annulohypoxylon truncatum]